MFDSKAKIIEDLKKKKIEDEDKAERDEADEFARQLGFDIDNSYEPGIEDIDKIKSPITSEDEEWMRKIAQEEGVEFLDEMNVSF